jgi:DNA-3-methyladenine glycosylase
MLLSREFYVRSADIVAEEILGSVLVRSVEGKTMKGRIVETEAYFGVDDPASRAFGGRIKQINRYMWEEGGIAFVYMVHGNWLFNIITGVKGEPSGILIRALEPLVGMEEMQRNRKGNRDLTGGPGKLTEALAITGEMSGVRVYEESAPVRVESGLKNGTIKRTKRIGVRLDLDRDLRFFLDGNPYVSR